MASIRSILDCPMFCPPLGDILLTDSVSIGSNLRFGMPVVEEFGIESQLAHATLAIASLDKVYALGCWLGMSEEVRSRLREDLSANRREWLQLLVTCFEQYRSSRG